LRRREAEGEERGEGKEKRRMRGGEEGGGFYKHLVTETNR